HHWTVDAAAAKTTNTIQQASATTAPATNPSRAQPNSAAANTQAIAAAKPATPKKSNADDLGKAASEAIIKTLGDKAVGIQIQGFSDGRIVVEGTVPSAEERSRADACLLAVKGCSRVENKLAAVAPPLTTVATTQPVAAPVTEDNKTSPVAEKTTVATEQPSSDRPLKVSAAASGPAPSVIVIPTPAQPPAVASNEAPAKI